MGTSSLENSPLLLFLFFQPVSADTGRENAQLVARVERKNFKYPEESLRFDEIPQKRGTCEKILCMRWKISCSIDTFDCHMYRCDYRLVSFNDVTRVLAVFK